MSCLLVFEHLERCSFNKNIRVNEYAFLTETQFCFCSGLNMNCLTNQIHGPVAAEKLYVNITWARIKFEPSKSRSPAIVRGKLRSEIPHR